MMKTLDYIFNRPNIFYALLSLPVFIMVYWQYSESSYISAMFQALCLGFTLNSWAFAVLQRKTRQQNDEHRKLIDELHKIEVNGQMAIIEQQAKQLDELTR